VLFDPSPCLRHYPERWATMVSADFCMIDAHVTMSAAMKHHFWWLS
jgi:hypothetical protein